VQVPEPRRPSELAFTVSARANVSFGRPAAGVGVEGAVGIGGKLWLVEVGVSGGHAVGLSARAGFQMRELLGPVGFHVLAEGVVLLAPGDGGLGGSAGVNVRLTSFLEAFAEGRFVYLLGSADYQRANGLLAVGVRVRLPLPL
jgi:hypothetical protein